tara:strand:- start:33 stop:518 length:486 start_codon:yes stop_codon:yes gene_type:complete
MWVLTKTKPNQENRAKKNLINQGFKCFLPILNTKKFVKNTWVDFKEIMFSGYLFIKLGDNVRNLHKINNTYGVSKLLVNKNTGLPYTISKTDMDQINEVIENNNHAEMIAGDNVVITNGKLSKFSGVFLEKCSKYRAKLLVHLLNREQCVIVDLDDVQKIY